MMSSTRDVTGRRTANRMEFMGLTAPGRFAAGRHPRLGLETSDGKVPSRRLRRKRVNTRQMTRIHEDQTFCRHARVFLNGASQSPGVLGRLAAGWGPGRRRSYG